MPDVSVTITPTGEAYTAVRQIIAALYAQCPDRGCALFEPHVTLQYVREAPDAETVARTLEPIARATRPFEIHLGDLGTFPSHPGVHVVVEPNPALTRLYRRVKDALRRCGLQTYEYDVDTWRPHVTLSCRHWAAEEVERVTSMFGDLQISFRAERMQVNRLDGTRWVVVRELPLGVPRARHQAA